MKIYIAHSKDFDYKNELYNPIRELEENINHEIILPHEKNDKSSNTRDFYKKIDLMIAECSYPATGLGIELGWVYDDNIPIYCIYKKGNKISGSTKSVTDNIIEYTNIEEMQTIIKSIIKIEEIKKRKIIRKKINNNKN